MKYHELVSDAQEFHALFQNAFLITISSLFLLGIHIIREQIPNISSRLKSLREDMGKI